MLRIVYLVNQLRKSGPVNVLKNIIIHLDRSKYSPVIVKFMNDDKTRSITDEFIELGVEVYNLQLSFWDLELRTAKVAKRVDKLLGDLSPNIIHTHGYHPVLVASRLTYPCLKIETLHCISGENFIYSKGIIIGNWMNWRYLKDLTYIDYSAAISKNVQEYYVKKKNLNKIKVIYNGVNDKLFKCDLNKEMYRQTIKMPLEKKIFVVVGALTENKDPITVIKAFKKAQKMIGNNAMELYFLGQGPLTPKCKELIENEPSIKLVGYVFNVQDYLKAADYSICASHSEGFGLNYVESLMANTPVISSRIGSFNEFSSFYPALSSLQFEPGNVNELVDIIVKVMTEPVYISMESIAADAVQRFSAINMSNQYMQMYSSLVNNDCKR